MLYFDLAEIILGLALADSQIGVLREEAKVRDRVYLATLIPSVVKYRLGEDVMNLQTGEVTEQVTV
jgi:hypothetical protein